MNIFTLTILRLKLTLTTLRSRTPGSDSRNFHLTDPELRNKMTNQFHGGYPAFSLVSVNIPPGVGLRILTKLSQQAPGNSREN